MVDKQKHTPESPWERQDAQKQTSENLNVILSTLKQWGVSKERMDYIVSYVLRTAEIESRYQAQSEQMKKDIRFFVESSLGNRLYKHLGEYNVAKFDVDKQKGFDEEEEKNYSHAIGESIGQIILLGWLNRFSVAHYESDDKSGWVDYIADIVNLQSYIFRDGNGKSFTDWLVQKVGNISELEFKRMQESPFHPTSAQSWEELWILLAKEFWSGVEQVLRFLWSIPSGLVLFASWRYLEYRIDSNSSDVVTRTIGEIKLKELTEQHPSLMLFELLWEKWIELIKKLWDMFTSGKQGDIAMMLVTIAWLIAGWAGAAKLWLRLTRKSMIKNASVAGPEARLAGETTSRVTRSKLKRTETNAWTVWNIASRIDDVVGWAGIGHMTGAYSKEKIKQNIDNSKKWRESSNFEELTQVEKRHVEYNKILADISSLNDANRSLVELWRKHKVQMRDGELHYDYSTKVPKELLPNYKDFLDAHDALLKSVNTVRSKLWLDLINHFWEFTPTVLSKAFVPADIFILLERWWWDFIIKAWILEDTFFSTVFRIESENHLRVLKDATFFKLQDKQIFDHLASLANENTSEFLEVLQGNYIDNTRLIPLLWEKSPESLIHLLRDEKCIQYLRQYIHFDEQLFIQLLWSTHYIENKRLLAQLEVFDIKDPAKLMSFIAQEWKLALYLSAWEWLPSFLAEKWTSAPRLLPWTWLPKITKELFDSRYTIDSNGVKSYNLSSSKDMTKIHPEFILENIDKFDVGFFDAERIQLLWQYADMRKYVDLFDIPASEKLRYKLRIKSLDAFEKLRARPDFDMLVSIQEHLSIDIDTIITKLWNNSQNIQNCFEFIRRLKESILNKDPEIRIWISMRYWIDSATDATHLFNVENIDFLEQNLEKFRKLWRSFSYSKIDFYKQCDLDLLISFYEKAGDSGIEKYYNSPNIDRIIPKYNEVKKSLGYSTKYISDDMGSAQLEHMLDLAKKYESLFSKINTFFGEWSVFHSPSDVKQIVESNIQSQKLPQLLEVLDYFDRSENHILRDIVKKQSKDKDNFTWLLDSLLQKENPLWEVQKFEKVLLDNIDKLKDIDGDIYKGIVEGARVDGERFLKMIETLQRLRESKSTEVTKLCNIIMVNLLDIADPIKAIDAIERVFIRNGIPMAWKLLRVFEQLYSDEKINTLITGNLSPVLVNQSSNSVRRFTMFRDLLKSHVLSGEPSLKAYFEILSDGESLLQKYESWVSLSPVEQNKFLYFLSKLNALGENKTIKLTSLDDYPNLSNDINQALSQVRSQLWIKEGQKIMDRVADLYLKPIWMNSVDEALKVMSDTKAFSDQRWRSYFDRAVKKDDGYYIQDMGAGDLVKWFESQYVWNVMKEGFVARDFLGTEWSHDLTPFDIDLIKLSETASFDWVVNTSESSKYWDLVAIIKNKWDIQEISKDTLNTYNRSNFELFQTWVRGDDHYGIRTALPSTQIDYLIFKWEPKNLDQVLFNIAKSWIYIPVVDKTGKVIFTPEMFDGLRNNVFSGIKEYGVPKFHLIEWAKNTVFDTKIRDHLPTEAEISAVDYTRNSIIDVVREWLGKLDIRLRKWLDDSIDGVELVDTWSTSRNTNLPGGFDFDFSAKLNEADFKKIPEIVTELKKSLSAENFTQTITQWDFVQYVIKWALVNGQKMDIDIGFTKYKQGSVIDANKATSMRLGSIRTAYGQEKYDAVVANIRLAKEILKEADVYKKWTHGQGGLGGIGTETWILNNGGSIEQAFKTFYAAAFRNQEKVSFHEFKKEYKVFGAGENLRSNFVEDFMNNMTEEGYEKMAEVISKYLK